MQFKKLILLFFTVFISGNAHAGWVWHKQEPKTLVDQLRAMDFKAMGQAIVQHKELSALAAAGIVGAGVIFHFRKPIVERLKQLRNALQSSYEAHPQMYKVLSGLSSLGIVGMFAHINGVDEYLADVAQQHPFLSGIVTGVIGTGFANNLMFKNALKENTQVIRELRESKKLKQVLFQVSSKLIANALSAEIEQLLRPHADGDLLLKLNAFLEIDCDDTRSDLERAVFAASLAC